MRKLGLTLLLVLLAVSLSWAQSEQQRAFENAVFLYNSGELNQAKTAFQEFLGMYDSSDHVPEVYTYLARLESNPDESRKYFQLIVDKYPLSDAADDALLGLAQYQYAKGNYTEAAEHYDQLIKEYPQSDLCAEASYWRANSRYLAGQVDLAELAFNDTFNNYPASEKAAWAMLDLAYLYQQRGNYDQAIQYYQMLIQRYPNSDVMSAAYFRYGESLAESGQMRDALTAYQKVLDDYPQSFEAAMVRGKDLDFSVLDQPASPPPVAAEDQPVQDAVDVTPDTATTETTTPAPETAAPESFTSTETEVTTETASDGGFYIQIGAYSNPDNAQLLKSTIEDGSTPVTIVQVDRGEKVLYRVWVGPYSSNNAAESAARQLVNDKGIRNYLVVQE